MKKLILLLIFVGIGFTGFAQEKIMLKGKIKSLSLEGSSINIVNLNNLVGTTNDRNGEFKILVSVNDSIVFSSIQFENLILKITPEIFEKEYVEVYLKNRIDELPEVKISNIKLTGDLKKDLENTPYYGIPASFDYTAIKNSRFEADLNDHQSAPRNMALGQGSEPMVSVDLFALASKIFKIKQVEGAKSPLATSSEIVKKVREVFGDPFFTHTLNIEEIMIDDFLYACADNGLSQKYRDMGNKMDLIDFLIDQSKIYNSTHTSN